MFHAWGIKTTEVRDGGLVYHQVSGAGLWAGYSAGRTAPTTGLLSWTTRCRLRALIRRGVKSLPAFVQNAEWRQASRGLLALAINNQNGALREGL